MCESSEYLQHTQSAKLLGWFIEQHNPQFFQRPENLTWDCIFLFFLTTFWKTMGWPHPWKHFYGKIIWTRETQSHISINQDSHHFIYIYISPYIYLLIYISFYIYIYIYIKSPLSILRHLRVVNLAFLKQRFDGCLIYTYIFISIYIYLYKRWIINLTNITNRFLYTMK